MEKYIQMIKSKGADAAIVINPETIVTAAWVIHKCRFGCSNYGRNHCCPPETPTYKETREIIDCYVKAILFQCQDMKIIASIAAEMSKEMFFDGYYKTIAMGSGPCRKCKGECNPDRCAFPDQRIPSMEACGIDVFATVRANGLEINTLRERNETARYFGLLLIE